MTRIDAQLGGPVPTHTLALLDSFAGHHTIRQSIRPLCLYSQSTHLIDTIVVVPVVDEAEDDSDAQLGGPVQDKVQGPEALLIVHTRGHLEVEGRMNRASVEG